MTIETLLTASIDRIVLRREVVKAGTVNGLIYLAAKALQSQKVFDVKRAHALIEQKVQDGSIELFANPDQMEMLQWGLDELEKFSTGEYMAVKERKSLDAAATRIADFNRAVQANSKYEF
jgi:hypothetical protein